MEILFLDSSPGPHHERFVDLLASLGNVHSIYVDLHQVPIRMSYDLIFFADLDVTVDHAIMFPAPKVGLSWAWDLQQTLRSGFNVREKLVKAVNSLDFLIVDSYVVEEEARKYGLSSDRIIRVPYGIQIEDYPLRKHKIQKEEKLRIYSNRRWEEMYRPQLVLEMAQELTRSGFPFELVMSNDGSLRKQLIESHVELFLNGSCSWLGRVDWHQNITELENADIYLSVAKSDGSSLSLLEAMAIGTPTLVTNNNANKQWIEDKLTGHLFSGNSGLELARTIQGIDLNNPSCFEMSISARSKVLDEANWSINKLQLLSHVHNLIS